jgi:hypothetical protein
VAGSVTNLNSPTHAGMILQFAPSALGNFEKILPAVFHDKKFPIPVKELQARLMISQTFQSLAHVLSTPKLLSKILMQLKKVLRLRRDTYLLLG